MSVSVAAIVLAGGSGSRAQAGLNKVYMPISGRPMLAYSLDTMFRSPRVDRLVLVSREEDRAQAENLVEELGSTKPTRVVGGGSTRHQSETAGLEALHADVDQGAIDLVAIHDSARPFMTLQLLDLLVDAARAHGGAVPGLGIPEPLYHAGGDEAELLHPDSMKRVQTPQVFRAKPLLSAYEAAREAGFDGVDTAETMERFSAIDVAVVPGDARNIKVTFVEDFYMAEEYVAEWENGAWV